MKTKTRSKGMNVTMAQLKYAYYHLTGKKISTDERMFQEGRELFVSHGKVAIFEVLKGYDAETYMNGGYPYLD